MNVRSTLSRLPLTSAIALAIAVVLPLPAHAQTAEASDTTEESGQESTPEADDTIQSNNQVGKDDTLPSVVVNAFPMQLGIDEIITPVVLLRGSELDDVKSATIGETLANELGIQTTSFGAGVGRPVIRGQEGSRVAVLSNGLSSGDVSNVSQDHAVAIEPFLADQIEVLKGPSTLLYGSGAIGGVVNVVDGRIPQGLPENGLSGRAELRGATADNSGTGMFRLDMGSGQFALHVDGAMRSADDYSTPVGTLANSFLDTESGAIGASWIGNRGYVGFAVSRYLDNYGNPAEPGDEEEGPVTLKLAQTRYDLKGELTDPMPGFNSLRFSFGHIDYTHTEFEGDEVGTVFNNDGNEGRIELVHNDVSGWKGAVGVQFLDRTFAAIGDEAFVPKTTTKGLGLFVLEQRDFGNFGLELGARIDSQSSEPDDGPKRDFNPFSLSAGASYRFTEEWHMTANLDRAERAPAEEELFANGPHLATGAFEIGDADLNEETANQLELGLHFHGDTVEVNLAAYTNRFNDFIYLDDTGDIEDDLPVRQWTQADARFNGFEGEAKIQLSSGPSGVYLLRVWGDTVNAYLTNGGELPRIAPARAGLDLYWNSDAWRANIGLAHYFKQDDVPDYETETAAFTMINAHLSYTFNADRRLSWEAFLDATNLGNDTARLSTSFIKDVAPLPGRSVALGIRAFF
ncbi:TonB-dependent receptor [Dokdonella sp.]|uniref:TonB-dependent receptor n=1 Tax=Dokdonella sp. TaxID=2291710 RepID=UPI003C62CB26